MRGSQIIKTIVLASLTRLSIAASCSLSPLGSGQDDTDQVEAAISECGQNGDIVFEPGDYNITRKMTWNLTNSKIDMFGYLSFIPDVEYWLDPDNTYRVVFIQSQASWFVVTGQNFTIDAHNSGGVQGNGQTWWNYFAQPNVTREDGDGRPISFTLFQVKNAVVKGFRVESQPFWCNTVAESEGVVYDGMSCNATNGNVEFAGQNIVPNTDGINTYRSNDVSMLNWDITCGDDCLAIKGNSTNIRASNITCHGGNGIAFGSLGQYSNLSDIVQNVDMEGLRMIRLPTNIQPNMANGVYFKTWTGTANGSPPTGGGGGGGFVTNVTTRNVSLNNVSRALHIYQTNGGHSNDTPSHLQFSNLSFVDWSGTAQSNELVDIECSSNAPCPGITFDDFDVQPPAGQAKRYVCINVLSESGLDAPCNATGEA